MFLHCYFKDEIGHIDQDVLTITTQSSFLFESKMRLDIQSSWTRRTAAQRVNDPLGCI